jgi:glycine/D-amino acid oxidase-like deaminating enzyme
VGSSQIAVGPVPEPLYARLLPKDRVYGNTNRVIYYFRGAPGLRRIVWGGRVGRFARADGPQRYAHLAREMLEVFPDLADVPVTHGWEGMIGYSHDEVPHIGQTREGIWYMLGYSGTGVSRSVYFGHKVALKVLGDPDGRTEFDDLAFDPFPMRPLTQRIVPVVEMWYRVRDRYGF